MTVFRATPAPYYRDLASGPVPDAQYIRAADGTRLRIATWATGTRGTILLFQGRSEYLEKYGQIYSALAERGFSIAAIDWRGQGLSDHPLGHNRTGDITDFTLFQHDAAAFLAHPAIAALPGPRILLAHSMGGCIGLRALMQGLQVDAAIFSAPMWGIHLSPALAPIAAPLSKTLSMIGLGALRVPLSGAKPYAVWHPETDNLLTSNYTAYKELRRQQSAAPDIGLGGPSFRWIARALEETARLAEDANPPVPMLTLLGSDERVVSPEAIHDRMDKPGHCHLVEIPGGRHEMFFETDGIRARVWQEIDSFLNPVA